MKTAILICMTDGEIDGDVRVFDISIGNENAISAWKERIRQNWDFESEEEVLSRIEDGIINDYNYSHNGYSFALYWSELEKRNENEVFSL